MSSSTETQLLILGIGNEFRGDDGLGVFIIRELQKTERPGIRLMEHSGEGASLMTLWEHAPHVLLIDAVKSGNPPGTLYHLDPIRDGVPRWFSLSSSHSFGVAEAIALSRHLKKLPGSLVIYGIEAESFAKGVGLSSSVVRAVPALLHSIEEYIERIHVGDPA